MAQRVRQQQAAGAAPPATKALVAVNVGVFLLTALTAGGGGLAGSGSGELESRLGLFGPDLKYGEWWQLYRLVSSGFLHFGLVHILFNMVILYRFGQMMEPALGSIRFSGLYTSALLTGSFGALLLSPHALTGGASGAVFGLFGAAAIGMHQRGVNVWQSGVGGLIVVNLVLTFVIPGIAIGGHLGGLVGGFLVGAFMFRQPTTRRSVIDGLLVSGVVSMAAVVGSILVAR
jgi:membrane associated rhomboid family serine protease